MTQTVPSGANASLDEPPRKTLPPASQMAVQATPSHRFAGP